MQIVRNVRIPVTVALAGAVLGSKSYKTVDVLMDAKVRAVYPLQVSEKLQQENVGVLVYDPATGEQLFVQAFDGMARPLSQVRRGSTICAIGKVHYFKGERFNVHSLVDYADLAVVTKESSLNQQETPADDENDYSEELVGAAGV